MSISIRAAMMSRRPARRLQSETVSFLIELEGGVHRVDFSMAYDGRGTLREIVFVGRGKIGHGLDILLHEISIKGSRAIQRRNPDTGDPLGETQEEIEIATKLPMILARMEEKRAADPPPVGGPVLLPNDGPYDERD